MHLKQDRMTSRERIDPLFAGKIHDRLPLGAKSTGFSTRNGGHTVADVYEDPGKSFAAMQWTTEQYGWNPVPQYAGHTVLGAWDFGGRVRMPRGECEGTLLVTEYPVKTEQDVEKLVLPDPRKAGRIPKALRFAQLQAEHDLPVFFFSRSPFSMAANIVGIDRFLRWAMKRPELCEHLLRLSIDHIFNVLALWVESFGSHRIFAWMTSPTESNQLISPRIIQKFALPYHVEYHRRLRELGVSRFGFHICGNQNLNLPILAEAAPWSHPSVLSFGHEVDLETAAGHFPKDIIFGLHPPDTAVGSVAHDDKLLKHSRCVRPLYLIACLTRASRGLDPGKPIFIGTRRLKFGDDSEESLIVHFFQPPGKQIPYEPKK